MLYYVERDIIFLRYYIEIDEKIFTNVKVNIF